MSVYIGIDTSNYTTSVAAVDENKTVIADARRLLPVSGGQLGLRQSDALFAHVKAFPQLMKSVADAIGGEKIAMVSVSEKPRNQEESYMPVFLAGRAFAETLSYANQIPIRYYSHQEGHIKAGVWSSDSEERPEFLAVHLSGGTTEILKVTKSIGRYDIDVVGKSLDIHAGQLIDRIGVLAGLAFPCGKELDRLAQTAAEVISYPVNVKNTDIHFSGAETHFKRAVQNGVHIAVIARSLFCAISDALVKAIRCAEKVTGIDNILLVGGVASNRIIRKRLSGAFSNIYFAKPEFSTDNAVGTALLGLEDCRLNLSYKP